MIRAFGLLMICTALAAQDAPRVEAPRLSRPPALTRNPDLSDWAGALRITDFGCWFPVDAGKPIVETVAQEFKLRLSGQVAYRELDERIKRHNTIGMEKQP